MLEVQLIADYLVENVYASTDQDAYNLIACMSDRWISSILEEVLLEMRKEDKVKGKTKTPMYTGKSRRGRVVRDESPSGDLSWKVLKSTHKTPNITAVLGRRRQGMSPEPGASVPRRLFPSEVRHPHGGGEPGTPQGSRRGVKHVKGVKIQPRETPVSRIKSKLDSRESAKNERIRLIGRPKDLSLGLNYNPTPKQLITRYPKLNLPNPSKKEEPTKRASRKTMMNKFGKARTAKEVLGTLNKISEQ